MTGSISQGKSSKFPYYHCTKTRCKGRYRAEKLNSSYEEILKKIYLRPEAFELISLVLEDENIFTCRRGYVEERKKIQSDISKQELYFSKARKYFLDEKIDFDDFSKLKKEHNEKLCQLNSQLNSITQKIVNCDLNENLWPVADFNVFQSYKYQDIKGRCDIINLITPASINHTTATIDSLKINESVSMIVDYRK